MSAKYTPGPWGVYADGGGYYVMAADNMLVGSTNPADPHPTDPDEVVDGAVTEANAVLLAAAPELLDMLERAVRRLEIAHANGDTIMREWVIDARAAVAKATGGAA